MKRQPRPAWKSFPPETLRSLFEAVEVDDIVDPIVSLPDPIDLHCTRETMRDCFALCWQFWRDGVVRDDLLELVTLLLREGDLSREQRIAYKHIRARYKHLRFALRLYGKGHEAPWLFNATVAVMGHLQDAFRNGHRRAVLGYGLLLRSLLAQPLWKATSRKVGAVRLDTASGFLAYRKAQIGRLKRMLEQQMLTGPEFHAMRKLVSQQVSFYDTLRSLEHSDLAYRMSRFLSAINGLMGARHDEMVEQAISDKGSYRTAMALDADIRWRLEMLVARYPL